MLEIEETNKTRTRKIPPFIAVSDEVSDTIEYRNSEIYKNKNKGKQTKKKC